MFVSRPVSLEISSILVRAYSKSGKPSVSGYRALQIGFVNFTTNLLNPCKLALEIGIMNSHHAHAGLSALNVKSNVSISNPFLSRHLFARNSSSYSGSGTGSGLISLVTLTT